MILAPDTSTSSEAAVGATSVQFGLSMLNPLNSSPNLYMFVSSTNCWIAQGSNPTASAGAGSMYVPAGVVVTLDGACGAKLAVIEDSAAGKASLTYARKY